MSAHRPHDVESIPADLDRFLGAFFSRRGWRSQIKYDPAADRLYLEVFLATPRLGEDDRFFSLVEYFARAQDSVLRKNAGLPLKCRVYGADGNELTALLHARGGSYLDDSRKGHGMRRRLAWLGFRRRFVWRVIPGALLWAAALVFVVGVVGLPLHVTFILALLALGVQALVTWYAGPRRR